MLRFLKKRFEKPPKSSSKPAPLKNPTRRAADIGTGCSGDTGTNYGGGSRITTQDGRIGDQQPPAPNVSTLTPGNESGDATPQGQEHTHRHSAGAQSERPDRNTPDFHFDGGDPKNRRRGEHEDRGPGVQETSEAAPECTSGGDQDDGDVHNPVKPRGSRAKERGWVDRALERTAFVVDLAKGPAEAFGPLKAVLESISGLYAQYQNTADVKDKIDTLRTRVAELEDLFEKPASDEMEKKRRKGLLIKLEGIEEQLRSLSGKPAFTRFVDNIPDSKDVDGLLGDLQEAIGDYMMMQQMAIHDQGCKLMDGQQDAAEKSALDNFCSAKRAEFRHGERKGCLEGTREAVLNAIELWARDPDQSCVYWLNGLAGTGKSTIAKTIAERLFATGHLGASFFCSRDFEDRRNIQLIFPTLAVQLARKYIKFRSILVPLIQSDKEIAYESLYNQMDKLIVQPLNQSDISTVIAIDALDECEDEEPASAILSVLGKLISKIPKVKFFLTGRPEPRISKGFRLPLLAKMSDIFVLHDIERSQVDSDIRLFFRNSFLELGDRWNGLENWPTEGQLDDLCRRAEGLFVYAAATVKFIDNNKKDPIDQLDLLLRSRKIGAREGKQLDSLYTSILREAFGDDGPEDDAKMRSVLGAVVLATNPLSPSTIATLLGLSTREVLPLLSSVSSLLIIQEDAVRPFHKSFPDFVTDPDRCTNKRFLIPPPIHHLQLLTSCLDLMNITLVKNMCNLPDAVANSDVGDLKERTERYIDPASRYACLSWHIHLANVDMIPARVPTITRTLHQFLGEKFLFWLEVLSVLGAVRNAVEALQATVDWLEEPSTLDLANDCLRFITGYFEVISASAPHIYHSALVFAPQESIVRKRYESHAHPFARVVCGLPASWDANTATATRPSRIEVAAWSPCNRFIAITWKYAETVDVLDSVTLQRLQTFKSLRDVGKYGVLVFSPDSRILTYCGRTPAEELLVVNWDLQTGGVAGVIRWQEPDGPIYGIDSVACSANGRMVGVCYWDSTANVIVILDVSSSVHMHSHSPVTIFGHISNIWTHGESLRFAIVGKTDITTWEIAFTSDARPTIVETLPVPETADRIVLPPHKLRPQFQGYIQTLPTACRFAVAYKDKVVVWDARNSKFLLRHTGHLGTEFHPRMTFSSDGRFFACPTAGSEVYLWKESPSGYILHEVLASSTPYSTSPYSIPTCSTLLSQNGESIVVFCDSTIRLWPTEGFVTPPSGVSIGAPQLTSDFVLDFSSDGTLATVARQGGKTVTVLNLKSGVPQLTINTGTKVHGLGVTEKAVTVISGHKVITWDLPSGDGVPNANATRENSTQKISLEPPPDSVISASISADSHRIAIITPNIFSLQVYNGSTGEKLLESRAVGSVSWFIPGGCDLVLVHNDGGGRVFRVGDGRAFRVGDRRAFRVGDRRAFRVGDGREMQEDRARRFHIDDPPEGYPWASSRGYRVTKDWWVLGPGGKRLLMLPPPWQSYVMRRVWNGPFLALLHGGLSEPVILELNQ